MYGMHLINLEGGGGFGPWDFIEVHLVTGEVEESVLFYLVGPSTLVHLNPLDPVGPEG